MFSLSKYNRVIDCINYPASMWNALIGEVTVFADKRIVFKFKSGVEIEEKM